MDVFLLQISLNFKVHVLLQLNSSVLVAFLWIKFSSWLKSCDSWLFFEDFRLRAAKNWKKIYLQRKLDRLIMMWKLWRLNEVSYLSFLLRFLHPCWKMSTCVQEFMFKLIFLCILRLEALLDICSENLNTYLNTVLGLLQWKINRV